MKSLALAILLIGCLIDFCQSELGPNGRSHGNSVLMQGNPVNGEEFARRRYEAARKLGTEHLNTVESKKILGGSRVQGTKVSDKYVFSPDSSSDASCDMVTLKRINECACFYTKSMQKLRGDQEVRCRRSLGVDISVMERGCSYFVDGVGRFNFKILQRRMGEMLLSCADSGAVPPVGRRAKLSGVVRIVPSPTEIGKVLNLLQELNKLLGQLFRTTGPTNGSSSRTVTVRVRKGFSPKAARLMVYNNIAVVKETNSTSP